MNTIADFGRKALAAASLVLLAGAIASCDQKQPTAAAPSTPPAGHRVYVTNERSGDLTVIDGQSGQVVATIPLGKRPRGVRASADGRTLYIALSGSPIAGPGIDEKTLPPPDKSADAIAVFDVAESKVQRLITGVSDPEQTAVSRAGKLYVASEDTGQALVIDIASGKTEAKIPVGEEPEGVDLTPDGRQVWVTSEEDATVTVIDTAANKVIKTIKVGERPRNTAFSADGGKAYISGEFDRSVRIVDTTSLDVVNTVKLADETLRPMDVKLTNDGKRLFVSTGRGQKILVLDASTLATVGEIAAGARPWGIGLSPDGAKLYTANGPSNDVTVIDTATMTATSTVPAGQGPWSLVVVPYPAQ
jgi:YVTN family beta-propeller protein